MNVLKYIFYSILISFFYVGCNHNEDEHKTETSFSVQKPIIRSNIDSSKYKAEIYRLDTLFQKLYTSNAFNGNVLVAKGNQLIYQKSFGYAIKEKNKLLNDTSLFQLASVSKVITGIGILLLYEQHKLNIDTPVCAILKDFPYKHITVKHLLSHRSGLPNYTYFCEEYLPRQTITLSNKDIFNLIVECQPNSYFEAGKKFNYSNTNYVLLALIIEKISKKKYSEFLIENLFSPLGMNHTYTFLPTDTGNNCITCGYTNSYRLVENDRFDGIYGDKGIFTTTYDLFLLSTALFQHKLLFQKTQDLAYKSYSPEKKLSNYGLGWRIKNMDNSEKEVFHNGWWHGYRTSFHRRLKDSLTIIVLSNRLNKSVYATWRIYAAVDGPSSPYYLKAMAEEE